MALRDQPYFPLYIRDFASDEKLRNCSAESVGVYIMVMCFLHMTPKYGSFTLEERQKKSSDNIENFACVLLRQLPFEIDEIKRGLRQLVVEGVLSIDGDTLFQKRMVKDGEISEIRAAAGSLGGSATQKRSKNSQANRKQNSSKTQAKNKQNTENEIEYENEIKKEGNKRSNSIPPTLEEVRAYAKERNSGVDPDRFFDYFDAGGWIDSKGNPVRNWKQKFITWETQQRKEVGNADRRDTAGGTSESNGRKKWGISSVPLDPG